MGKGHCESERVTILVMASPGADVTFQDLRNSQFLLLDTYFLSYSTVEGTVYSTVYSRVYSIQYSIVYSRRWPYFKSCIPTALLKLLCIDLCFFYYINVIACTSNGDLTMVVLHFSKSLALDKQRWPDYISDVNWRVVQRQMI